MPEPEEEDGDICAGGGEAFRHGAADAAACARDQHVLAGKIIVKSSHGSAFSCMHDTAATVHKNLRGKDLRHLLCRCGAKSVFAENKGETSPPFRSPIIFYIIKNLCH